MSDDRVQLHGYLEDAWTFGPDEDLSGVRAALADLYERERSGKKARVDIKPDGRIIVSTLFPREESHE